ncbi:EF-hand domain pair [Cinara cedri]|uniref:EF-hand domain pair n=1 Tax=Cinara cedri TaxID=506608 RepID=A0A5E4N512_9HEMI|nr:EF-hand domain pair [Cinara cedri]
MATGDAPPNGKHVRSHSLKSFPLVAAAVIDGTVKKPDDHGGGDGDSHATISAAKLTSTWKQACDRTRDRTRQLLRRTMSWKSNTIVMQQPAEESKPDDISSTWEIHVWASWMKRYASEDESKTLDMPFKLSTLQEEKFLNFFKYYLDGDCDGFVFEHDFHQFAEKLRRFADWSPSSDEYIILKQVLRELIQVFIPCESGQNVAFVSLSTDDWLKIWCQTLSSCAVAPDMPLWLKYFQNILFKSLDSGKGEIEKANLQRFYSTFLDANCEEAKQVVIDVVYNSLTSNGDFRLDRETWGQCFANWLLGTKPNGCGQWLFGKCGPIPEFFPIDYSAMNSTADTRDIYSHKRRSDRHSIVV